MNQSDYGVIFVQFLLKNRLKIQGSRWLYCQSYNICDIYTALKCCYSAVQGVRKACRYYRVKKNYFRVVQLVVRNEFGRHQEVSGSDRTVLFLRQRAQGLWRAERGAAGPLLHAEEEAAERILPHGDLTTTG